MQDQDHGFIFNTTQDIASATTDTLSFSLMLSKGALTVHKRSIYRLILYIIRMDPMYIERILVFARTLPEASTSFFYTVSKLCGVNGVYRQHPLGGTCIFDRYCAYISERRDASNDEAIKHRIYNELPFERDATFHINSRILRLAILMAQSRVLLFMAAQTHPSEYQSCTATPVPASDAPPSHASTGRQRLSPTPNDGAQLANTSLTTSRS